MEYRGTAKQNKFVLFCYFEHYGEAGAKNYETEYESACGWFFHEVARKTERQRFQTLVITAMNW